MTDVTIVGTGFAGIGMAIALKRAGNESFTVLERAFEIGGTWRDNTYPGCACDIPSMLYSFSFEPNADWTRVFPQQEEIWAYLRACVDRHALRPHIRFNTEVTEARYDEARDLWVVRTTDGEQIESRVLVSGMGGLSNPYIPAIPGQASFRGTTFHSAQWNHAYDLRGKRIAVIGTGASAVQFVPQIAPQVEHLTLFQRTPPWIMARPDMPISARRRALRRFTPYAWAMRQLIYWMLEFRALGFTITPRLLQWTEAIARKHLSAQVPEPELRRKLTPSYRMGCKRILLSNDFYPALRRENVALVETPIREIREHGILTADGVEYPVDAIVFGTGFRAQEFVSPVRIYGRGGVEVGEEWKRDAGAYMGINVTGFPNLFFLVGPNTGLGHNSMVIMIEAQIRYVMSALSVMRKRNIRTLDVKHNVQSRFNAALQHRMRRTVWTGGCKSWYLDENGKNTTLWPGFTFTYRWFTRRLNPTRYDMT